MVAVMVAVKIAEPKFPQNYTKKAAETQCFCGLFCASWALLFDTVPCSPKK